MSNSTRASHIRGEVSRAGLMENRNATFSLASNVATSQRAHSLQRSQLSSMMGSSSPDFMHQRSPGSSKGGRNANFDLAPVTAKKTLNRTSLLGK